MAMHTLYICTTCKKRNEDEVVDSSLGEKLYLAVEAAYKKEDGLSALVLKPQECLSSCKRGGVVALACPKKYSYVLGNLEVENTGDILALAKTYLSKDDGILKKIDRPESLKQKVLGRIPPFMGEG